MAVGGWSTPGCGRSHLTRADLCLAPALLLRTLMFSRAMPACSKSIPSITFSGSKTSTLLLLFLAPLQAGRAGGGGAEGVGPERAGGRGFWAVDGTNGSERTRM